MQDKNNTINPYILTIYALDILENSHQNHEVENFIKWYTKRANKLDKFGVSGTIYDYHIDKNGTEYSLEKYDSADGYAGLYLYLLAKYYKKTKNKQLIKNAWSTIEDNVYLLAHLQDEDGLTKALATKDYHVKFLMDNVESHIGVTAYLYLANELQMSTKNYTYLQSSLKEAILRELYNPQANNFYWAKEKSHLSPINTNIFYPDVFAQMHMLAFWGQELNPDVAKTLWSSITQFIQHNKTQLSMEQLIIFNWAKTFALNNNL